MDPNNMDLEAGVDVPKFSYNSHVTPGLAPQSFCLYRQFFFGIFVRSYDVVSRLVGWAKP